jgi:UDP-N-acetylglucosamine--N-acetylmuramyl-(pentapeptide) pyrophosphoryl-undecaprenol N-acetylglucosamine transferase
VTASSHRSAGVVVTGGGTAGHALPALAILQRLAARGWSADTLHYVGTERGIEQRVFADQPFATTYLDVVGLQRSLSPRNLAFVPKLVTSTWRAIRLLGRIRPAVVVNVGGYGSMPATFAARVRGIPVVVVSYDRLPGLASKVAARFAVAVAAAFDDTPLRRARRTGAPLRPEMIAVDRRADRAAAMDELGIETGRRLITVFGGSLGAQPLNDAVVGLAGRWLHRDDLAVHHVVGERFVDEVMASLPSGLAAVAGRKAAGRSAAGGRAAEELPAQSTESPGIMYRVIGYESRMAALYAASELMVTRAGASTIAELAATGTPSVLVPWPGAAERHQHDNASTLVAVGAAVMIDQDDLTVDRLVDVVGGLLDDPDQLDSMSRAAHQAGSAHRSDALLDLIDEVAAR